MSECATAKEKTETRLDPCPFCGEKDAICIKAFDLTIGKGHYAACECCDVRGPWRHKPDDAAEAWNRGEAPRLKQKAVDANSPIAFRERLGKLLDDGWAITPNVRDFYDVYNNFCIVEKTDG